MNDLRVNNYAAFAGVTIPHQRLHITGAKLQHFFHSHNSSTTFFFAPPYHLRFGLIWDITQPNGVKQYKIGKEVDITPNSSGTLRSRI
jgi:hypothetical protein